MTLSIMEGIQPGPLVQYFHSALQGGSGDDGGLVQRLQLFVFPCAPRTWSNIDRAPNAKASMRAQECFAKLDELARSRER